jgi:hypothetical protein
LLLASRTSQEKLFSPLKRAFFFDFLPPEPSIETFSQWAYSREAMKIARFLPVSIAGLFLMTLCAAADSSSSDSGSNAATPDMQVDPDGVPLSAQEQQLSQEDHDILQKEKQRAAQNKNWLLRGYEQQLQNHAGTEGNLYYQLTSNKELAKLAGLPVLDDGDQSGLRPNQTGISPAASSSATLRPDASTSPGYKSTPGFLSSPWMKPQNSSMPEGIQSFSSSLPLAMPSPLAINFLPAQLQATAKATDDQSTDSSDISMPGMIAAKSTLTDPTDSADSTLDILPGETIEHARDHQDDNSSLLVLPVAMDADQLHQTQAATLNPSTPNSPAKTAKTPPPVNVNAKPVEDQEAPMPVDKTPAITPIRSPIANPFDILNH